MQALIEKIESQNVVVLEETFSMSYSMFQLNAI
jgi:hypothetical protein